MEAAAAARGVAFLDAPVSGTSSMVSRRDCVVTVGGDRAVFARALPVLEAIARRVFHVGRCGMGSTLKLVTNLIMGLNGMVLAEGLTLARRAGLDPAQTLEILSQGAAASKMLEVRGPLMVEGRFDPLMKIDLFLKDIRLMLEVGQEQHVALPLAGMMQQLYTAAFAGGQAKDDLAGIVRLYETMAGLPAVRRQPSPDPEEQRG
jgi:3-hydroxyisobutyrate dehydrogenase-like beta-hydroxyacid dehydrogenase